MKKLIYVALFLALPCVFSSFTVATKAEAKIAQKALKQQTRVAGYFTKDGNIYEVWVEDEPDGFATVVDVYITNSTSVGVDSFSGTLDASGVLRLGVSLDDSTSFYYSGRLRINP